MKHGFTHQQKIQHAFRLAREYGRAYPMSKDEHAKIAPGWDRIINVKRTKPSKPW